MPSVLVVAYFFPPLGGAGVQRTLKFVRYLPEYGWLPYILTVSDKAGQQDPSLLAEIPAGIPVYRAPAVRFPAGLAWRVRNFITRWFLMVDEQVMWIPFALSAGRKILRGNREIKLIYSSSSPYSSHLVAQRLQAQAHLPWVADFRDPWLENPYIDFPTTFHKRINERLERAIFVQADRIIVNTERTRQRYVNKYPQLPASKISVVPNGYDPHDIPDRGDRLDPTTSFSISHLGSFSPRSRSSQYFLEALLKDIQSGVIPPNQIKVRLIGDIDKETHRFVSQHHLEGMVDVVGYLPHQQALCYLATADLLLLVDSYGAGSDQFVPAKLFEYLACQKPILCLADSGACADLVLDARAGSIIAPTDVDKIAGELVRLYQLWKKGQLKIDPNMDLIASFDRQKLTGNLAALFSEII
jgi:glycosyltransferase involved in cell wall biosynthesis